MVQKFICVLFLALVSVLNKLFFTIAYTSHRDDSPEEIVAKNQVYFPCILFPMLILTNCIVEFTFVDFTMHSVWWKLGKSKLK